MSPDTDRVEARGVVVDQHHAAVAGAFGVKSWRVENPDELEQVLRQALAHDGPTLVDVISQPLHEAAAPVSEWVA